VHDLVVDRIRQKNAGLKIDRKIIETSGDTSKGRSLFSLEQRGIFDKEVDQAVSEGRVDFAVHNMKDVPVNDRNLLCSAEKINHHSDSMSGIIRNALLTGENWRNLKNRISETAIQVALDLEGNNKQKAAERLGVDVRTVQQYVKKK